ncbi:hypothetical protein lbkm_3859 [Lachnospiraceae bacterium KM106-2]|nr:hypothetical protein lbkm_3859 [Lachnospiraceae bacterium KM106-2]
MELKEIGKIKVEGESMFLQIYEPYRKGTRGLKEFSHIDILWWFDRCDNEESRRVLEIPKPYQKAPDTLGVFATRSPQRPNPIALSVVQILYMDEEQGRIYVTFIDALDGSSILDLKPYTPSLDRVNEPEVPSWCSHWPDCYEKSGEFNWEEEFLF